MKKSKGETAFNICNISLMVLLSFVCIIPLWLIIVASFSSGTAISKFGYTLMVKEFSFSSYIYIFSAQKLFMNSMLMAVYITVLGTALVIFTSCLFGYSLSRTRLVGRKFLNIFLVITMLFAGGTIPYYLIVTGLGLKNTLWAIILPSGANAWNIILIRNFFQNLPQSLSESAEIEGANNLQILLKIVMPLGFPIIATTILFTGIGFWNNWFGPMLFLDSNHRNLWPVQAVLREMQASFESLISAVGGGSINELNSEGIKSAATIISTLPIMMVYPFLQKYFITGVVTGSVKE